MRFYRLLIIVLCCPVCCYAQSSLTLDEAIATAVRNNYDIAIAKNNAQSASNDYTSGNAGYLPEANLTLSATYGNAMQQQKLGTGESVSRSSVGTLSLNSGVGVTWTVYNGMKSSATYGKLGELRDASVLRSDLEREDLVATVTVAYYDLVRQKQSMRATNEAIAISDERVKIAETKFSVGSVARTDVLQAQVDRNVQRGTLLRQQQDYGVSKTQFNNLLARDAATEFDVSDSIALDYHPDLEELKRRAVQNNRELLLQQKSIGIAEDVRKEFESDRYPTVSLNAGYGLTLTDNTAGSILFNRSNGFTAGVSASWNLFDGHNTARRIENASIGITVQQLTYEQMKSRVQMNVLVAYNTYTSALAILALDEENVRLAKDNIGIAMERFRVGKSVTLELMVAQKSYEDALARVITSRFQAKSAETALRRLTGEL